MQFIAGTIHHSATDLANHLACQHLTHLNLSAATGKLKRPKWEDPQVDVLQQRGFEHEEAYLTWLRGQGLTVERIEAPDGASAEDATLRAMKQGTDVIVQATLRSGTWFGRADVLRRVDRPSELGEWAYEVTDTKLARETKAGTVLQLCVYSEIVGVIQGVMPEWMHVISPGKDWVPESFRLDDFLAYYRVVKRSLEGVTGAKQETEDGTYPEPVPHCDICDWWSHCDQRRRDDDHLSLVAGITRDQRRVLEEWDVETLAELATLPLPLANKPRRGAAGSYLRVREQARVQLEERTTGIPVHELLDREPGRGLGQLPPPSPGDVFFDIEGDPFAMDGGLEYLFGWATIDGNGSPVYEKRWAVNRAQEREVFETFIDMVVARKQPFSDMHIYHYAPYETAAVKRLMGRFGSRQEEVDQLLRTETFVDLHSVVKQAVRASVENYSIKKMEKFYEFTRAEELRSASVGLHEVERALELGRPDAITHELRTIVETYNKDDCVSALELRAWLEKLRTDLEKSGEVVPRPEPPEDEEGSEDVTQVQQIMARLLDGVPEERDERDEEQHARWLLAHLLEWHRRENKVVWWEFFHLASLTDDQLVEERPAAAHLEFMDTVGGKPKYPVHRYRFAHQEMDIGDGATLYQDGGAKIGTCAGVDLIHRTIDIKKRGDSADKHPTSVFAHDVVRTGVLSIALVRLAEWVLENGVDGAGEFRAARDLLLGREPRARVPRVSDTALIKENETSLDAARRLVSELDDGVLAIQGPPGAGKTYTAARMICDLVRAGKRVGVTANSHRVIRNLLSKTIEAAEEADLAIACAQKVSGKVAEYEGGALREVKDNKDVLKLLTDGDVQVAAGTPWLWAREDMAGTVDALFVDEAGQMSLANALAVSQCASNLVLLGDPQQLEQPLQATHPEGTDASALQHLLGDHLTMPPHLGLLLPHTWRMHPSICDFTSELFYENRLASRPELVAQELIGTTDFVGAGLWFVPVDHDGNSNASEEEVQRVAEIWESLTGGDVRWRDQEGGEHRIGPRDVLIVAPYNAQVGDIGERLPDARVGTVDKFQGQEAPVVIYSMATSSPNEAPRGMEFLYSLNRLNVATSRARCVCILVASPRLFAPECRTPQQMRLANALCRYVEMATVLPLT